MLMLRAVVFIIINKSYSYSVTLSENYLFLNNIIPVIYIYNRKLKKCNY